MKKNEMEIFLGEFYELCVARGFYRATMKKTSNAAEMRDCQDTVRELSLKINVLRDLAKKLRIDPNPTIDAAEKIGEERAR